MTFDDLYHPVKSFFRTRRMRRFYRELCLTPQTRVLDVGGDLFNWTLVSDLPRLTLLNLFPPLNRPAGSAGIVADGRYLPFKGSAFDIVYSNSVIEHLGDRENQVLFARECQRVGIRYYVQTPNKWFVIEPHLLAPFVHWLPRSMRKQLLRYFTLWGWFARPTPERSEKVLNEICLLDERGMRYLFPDSEIWHERIMGLTKSLIAVRNRGPLSGSDGWKGQVIARREAILAAGRE